MTKTEKTVKKDILYIALFSLLVSLLISCSGRGHFYTLKVIRSGEGWGYEIKINNQTYIHQPHIPAVEGNLPFSNKKTARKTGRIVIKKLKEHKPPGLTREEIDNILKDN
jgi:hypothetical protein